MRDTDYGKMPGAERIFWFDQNSFKFEPEDPLEIARKSEKLKEIGKDRYGEMFAEECMAWELEEKAKAIKIMTDMKEYYSTFETITKGIMITTLDILKRIRECPAYKK
jgi:hypothetical protein